MIPAEPYRISRWPPHPAASGDAHATGFPLPLPGEVHLWRIDLDGLDHRPAGEELTGFQNLSGLERGGHRDARRDETSPLLSPAEEERAARLIAPDARRRFRRARGALRTLLGAYLSCPPAALRFGLRGQGKPFLLDPASPLEFNLSHCQGLALLAISSGDEVGVDLERIEPRGDLLRIARRVFPAAVAEALSALPPTECNAAFYYHWTRFEAQVKARGEGVFLAGDAPVSRQVRSLAPEPGWLAAVAGEGIYAPPERWSFWNYR